MTTSEFIYMLKKADPQGTAHIRLGSGEVPYGAELRPGYYDGPYTYLDKDGRYVLTNQGEKVDIFCKDTTSIVWDCGWNPWKNSPDAEWEKVKSKFIVDFGAYAVKEQREEREDAFFKNIKEEFDAMIDSQKPAWEKRLDDVVDRYKSGWRYYQWSDEKALKYYDWKIISPLGVNMGGANLATSCPILESGMFSPVEVNQHNPSLMENIKNILFGKDKKKYIEWILK